MSNLIRDTLCRVPDFCNPPIYTVIGPFYPAVIQVVGGMMSDQRQLHIELLIYSMTKLVMDLSAGSADGNRTFTIPDNVGEGGKKQNYFTTVRGPKLTEDFHLNWKSPKRPNINFVLFSTTEF